MTTNLPKDLWRASAVALVKAIAAGAISSREAVQSCLDRMDAVNPAINAVVEPLHSAALQAADRADADRRAGRELGLLHGVPVTTKINVDQQDSATSNGVVAFKDAIAKADSPVVANMRKAGAIIIGRTNTPAFSMRWYTENDLHGRTLNPWDATRTPGGSSGGAAAAVAAGIGPIAHGNDGGGSIRYPAYCCGVAGLRPSWGRIPAYTDTPKERALSMQFISVQGPIARHVADIRLALKVMAQSDPRDPWWVPAPLEGEAAARPIKIGVAIDPLGLGVDPVVAQSIERAATQLRNAGYIVEDVTPPLLSEAACDWNDYAQGETRMTALPAVYQFADARAKRAMELMMARTPEMTVETLQVLASRRPSHLRQWQLFQQQYPLLLCPVSLEPALPYDVDIENESSVDRLYRSHVYLFAIALLGLPSISVPTGLVNGLPTGVQIVGPRFREDLVMECAEVIEACNAPITPTDPH